MQYLKKATLKSESESFIEITFYRVNNFQHLLREKTTDGNKNKSNISIRKQLILGTAAVTVMQIFHNALQLSTPTIKK